MFRVAIVVSGVSDPFWNQQTDMVGAFLGGGVVKGTANSLFQHIQLCWNPWTDYGGFYSKKSWAWPLLVAKVLHYQISYSYKMGPYQL